MKKKLSQIAEKGSSLTEILIMISLLSLLLISGFRHWLLWLEYQQLQETSQGLVWFLQQGRSAAQRFNRDFILKQGDRKKGCWLFFIHKPSAEWKRAVTTTRVRNTEKTPANPKITTISTPTVRKCWQPYYSEKTQLVIVGTPGFYGLPATAKAGSILLAIGRSKIQILISTRARIRTAIPE